jgi:hypothetical protein
MGHVESIERPPTKARDPGSPLLAQRGAISAALLLAAYFLVSRLVFARLHIQTQGTGSAWISLMDGALIVSLAALWLTLRGEESRLARELRTARTGSAELRALALRQRQKQPFLARLCTTHLGTAALLLADGDADEAHRELKKSSLLGRGGRLEILRQAVEADELRATGSPADLVRAIDRLGALPSTHNREADLYKTHVLVKAVLQKGDAERAQELCAELERSPEEDERLYSVWLVVWFEGGDGTSEAPPRQGRDPEGVGNREAAPGETAFAEGDLRMATLLARAQGADKLVELLEERVTRTAAPIANAQPRE